MIPLQIRITDHEATLTAAAVPYGAALLSEIDFAFIVDVDGDEVVMSPYEFACHSAVCAPPNKKGTGGKGGSEPKGGAKAEGGPYTSGSVGGGGGTGGLDENGLPHIGTGYAAKKGHIGESDDARDIGIVSKKVAGGVRKDGILSEPWLDEKGEVHLTPAQEKAAADKLKGLGTSEREWIENIKASALKAMNNDEALTKADAEWYRIEHDTWGMPLAKQHDISIEQVMGMAAATSTLKRWSGVKNNNKEVVENILRMLKEDKEITITPEIAKSYADFSVAGAGGKYGPRTIEPGTYKMSEMSSGMLARVMGSGYGIGGFYKTDGLFKAFSIARGELQPNVAIGSLKQRSFTNNLVHPDIDYSSTNDVWMARAMFGIGKELNLGGKQTTIRDWEVETGTKPNAMFGAEKTGSSSLFAVATRASRTALQELARQDPRFAGMMLHGLQAIVWVQTQREYKERGWIADD